MSKEKLIQELRNAMDESVEVKFDSGATELIDGYWKMYAPRLRKRVLDILVKHTSALTVSPYADLLSCDKCGGTPVIEEREPLVYEHPFWRVYCYRCGASASSPNRDEAIAEWNRRGV